MKKFYLSVLLVVSIVTTLTAQTFEPFNFSGALNANGWTTHSGTAGQFQTLTTPADFGNSLSFTGLEVSAGNRATYVAGNSEDVNKAVTGITGTGYYSFLLKVTNTTGLSTVGDYFTGFGSTTGASVTIFAPRVYIKAGVTPGTFQLGIQNTTGGTPTQTYSAEYPVGTTVLVVIKLNTTVAPIEASMFINPIPGAAEPAATISNNSGTNTFSTFASIFLRQGGNATAGTGNLEIDEIRVGSTFESVTPPATCNSYNTINVSSCLTYTVPSGDETHTTSGTYYDTIPNAALCDSILTINLTIHQNETNTDAQTICNGDTYVFGTQNLTTGGVYNETFTNQYGCDSTVTLTLTVVNGVNYYQDLDADNYGNSNVSIFTCSPPPGYVLIGGDCDDNNNLINPGATEICNNIDDNCDGNIDENAGTVYYADLDNDGFGNPSSTLTSCTPVAGYVVDNTDCDDANPAINPSATDVPDNGIDEDCSGADASGPMLGIYEFTGATMCPNDVPYVTTQPTNATFSDYASFGTNCTAANNVFNMSGWNTTATIDLAEYNEFTLTAADCYQLNLTKLTFDHRNSGTGNASWHVRSSVDNYSTDIATGLSSSTIANAVVLLGASFMNLDQITFRFYVTNAASAGTTWRQDNVALFGDFTTLTAQVYYADADSDGYGDPAVNITACTVPNGYVNNSDDCDDTNPVINPTTVWYADVDQDGYGDNNATFVGCTPPANYTLDNQDCDDNNAAVTLGSPYFIDADNDGFGAGAAVYLCTTPGTGYATNSTDCDDSEPTVYPGAPEICDGLDNDCNGSADDGLNFQNWFIDNDNDNFGTGTPIVACESPGSNYVNATGDCNDNNASIYPGATEIIGDAIDQNCDGVDGYLSVDEISKLTVIVAPNPSTGVFSIELSSNEPTQLTVTDLNGKIQVIQTLTSNSTSLNLSTLEKGVYILTLSNEQGTAQTRVVLQ